MDVNELAYELMMSPGQKKITISDVDFMKYREAKQTYSSRDSHVVTHRSTSPPVRSLSTGEEV